jgi:hypothetical protein
VVSGRYCDICKDLVGDLWYKVGGYGENLDRNERILLKLQCQDCEDYDLCKKCKTHLMINPEHTFKETKADVKVGGIENYLTMTTDFPLHLANCSKRNLGCLDGRIQ